MFRHRLEQTAKAALQRNDSEGESLRASRA